MKYDYEESGSKYTVWLSVKDSDIHFQVQDLNNPPDSYSDSFSISDLSEKNKSFNLFDTNEECLKFLNDIFTKDDFKVIKKSGEVQLKLRFLNTFRNIVEEIFLNLPKINSERNNQFNELLSSNQTLNDDIMSLRSKNSTLETTITSLEKVNSDLNFKVNTLETKIGSLENMINALKTRNSTLETNLQDSEKFNIALHRMNEELKVKLQKTELSIIKCKRCEGRGTVKELTCPLCNGLKQFNDLNFYRCLVCTFKCGYENPPKNPKEGDKIYFCQFCKGKGYTP